MEVMNLGIVVGKGSFGVIYKAEWQGQVVAAKDLQVPEGLVDREQVEQGLRREVKVLSQLNHLNIVRFLGCHIAEMVIMTELCERGSLRCVLDDEGGSLTVARRFHFLKDIACGMNYLHNLAKPTLHHDLKPHNVLVASDWTAKVADFGLPPSSPRPWATPPNGAAAARFGIRRRNYSTRLRSCSRRMCTRLECWRRRPCTRTHDGGRGPPAPPR
jgi:serine/threonine protein kinase